MLFPPLLRTINLINLSSFTKKKRKKNNRTWKIAIKLFFKRCDIQLFFCICIQYFIITPRNSIQMLMTQKLLCDNSDRKQRLWYNKISVSIIIFVWFDINVLWLYHGFYCPFSWIYYNNLGSEAFEKKTKGLFA